LRAGRKELLEALLPKLGVGDWGLGIDPKPQSQIPNPLWLEIGFGGGEHLAAQALANSNAHLIGCEPYIDGVGTLLAQLHEHKIQNVRVWADDARLLLEKLPDACLDRAFILFPDPWPKTRHHKRRLIQKPLLDALARVLQPGAELRLATDHAAYAEWMLERLTAHESFIWTATSKKDWENPPADWVHTRYQEWAESEGRPTTYLSFLRKKY
jgi:tRNA (guanine-N7-)-methyltransferase